LSGANTEGQKSAEEVVEWYNCTPLHHIYGERTNHLHVANIQTREAQLEPKRIHNSSLRQLIRKLILTGEMQLGKQSSFIKCITTNLLWVLRLCIFDCRDKHQQCQLVIPSPLRIYETSAPVQILY
ncbi:hypothetical protein T4C_6826, partial [Trichinella pseudospiralis]